uniref:SusC/RagA family TonB-linked outer membrane protein n=1 Tax=Roseihalotalea indica TaxID=2867963 RepID=A0AA49JJ03_9BACT|nr:SusC/RagA family TonB-linked outer membrane protein [Tunicatimonas sp. TK19036]
MKTPILQKLLWLTRGTLCILLVQALSISLLLAADGKAQDVLSVKEMRVSLLLNNEDIIQAFKKIESLSSFTFEYNASDLKKTERVSGRYNNQTLYDILVDISRQTGIKFKQVGNNIAAAPKSEKETEQKEVEIIPQISVSGKVTDQENGDALPGVNVVEKGTSNGTVTDIDGNYSVNVNENATLVFSSIGYTTQEIPVNGRSTIDIAMPSDVQSLEEIVVIGYGTQEKKDVTGSIATVDQRDFEAQPVTRFDQILQGRTPGVNVTNSSGAPGGAVSIRIRGANSINGSNEPLYVVDGFVGANFRDVNPSDIESIQVLKDASATAIYGSRGANGVVLITTRSGKAGEPKLSVTARFNSSQILDTWDLMDAATFAEVANQRATALGTTLPFTDAEIAGFRQNGGTDWQNELLRTGLGQEYQVDYSGGKDAVTYFISGNYLDQEGIIINSDFKRYSLRTNLKANLSEKLSANLKMNFVRRENNNTEGNGNTSGSIAGALAWAPTTPARDANGVPTVRDPISSIKGNPIEMALNDNINESNTLNANGGFNYEIVDGLTADVSFGISYINTQLKTFTASRINDNPSAYRGSEERIFLQNTNTLNYNHVFNDIHNLTVTGVVEHQLLRTDIFGTTAVGLQFPELRFDNITLAGSVTSQATKEKQTIRSYIGRINYTLMDRYLITASVRADGSSKFRGANKYGTFPSMALGWRISEENFMQDLDFLTDLKLRGSYGITGSQALPVFGTVTTFYTNDERAGTSFENGQLTSGIIIGNPGNSNLKWETTEQLNVGLDLQVFNGRLGLTADYFQKNTKDLLVSEPLPQYSGGGSIFRNLGEVENNGFEFGLTSTVVDRGAFNWYSSFNVSFLNNEVVSIGDREQIFSDGDAGAGLTNLPEMVIMPGHSLASYWGLNYLGVWSTAEAAEAAEYGNVPGDSKYEDVNGDGAIGGDDYQIIGSAIPTRLLGWNNTFSYKNFTLNVFLQSMMGYDKWNFTYAQAVLAAADAREITHVDIQDRWVANTNEDSDIPAFSESDVAEIQSSRFVESGNFLRLKNVSLTYNLPNELLGGINGSVMVGATNLFTLTDYRGIDPESYSNVGTGEARGADAGSYPNAKTWTLGINLTF